MAGVFRAQRLSNIKLKFHMVGFEKYFYFSFKLDVPSQPSLCQEWIEMWKTKEL